MYKAIPRREPHDLVAIMIVIYYAVSPFLYLLRTFSGDSSITAVILRSSQPILMLTTLGVCLLKNRFRLNAYSLTLILLGVYGVLIALIHGNQWIDWMGGYLHYMTGIVVWMYFYSNHELNVDQFMRALSRYTLMSYFIVIVYMYTMNFLEISIYLGVACQVLVVVFFYNIHKRRFFLTLCSLVLILASGKRGVFAALMIGSAISLFFIFRHLQFRKKLNVLFSIGLSVILLVAIFPYASERLVSKYVYTENKTVDDYSAGRWNEVISAYDAWANQLETMLVGSGFGFTYTYVHSQSNIADVQDYKNVHFSYLNPPIIFGLPMSFVYYVCLLLLFSKSFRNPEPRFLYMKWASLTYMIYACFVFNLFDEPIFWMMNGLLFNDRYDLKKQVLGRSTCASNQI